MNNKPVSTVYFQNLNMPENALASLFGLDWIIFLQTQHLMQLPFSSANVLLGLELSLDDNPLLDRLLVKRRGGYCFEHNKIFFKVLQENAFDVQALMARVLNNQDIDAPKTHRLTLLTLDGERYAVDVGFGANCPIEPIKISDQDTVCSDGSRYRVVRNDRGDYLLQLKKVSGYYTLYSFDLARYVDPDFEMAHFYSHRHPQAGFVNNLVVSRIIDGERRSIRNRSYQVICGDVIEETGIDSAEQLQALLKKDFEYPLSDDECTTLYEKYCVQ
jgi:N-hydroxyarylamine O-acetyltransferase